MRRSERIIKSPQQYDPGFWAEIEGNSDAVASKVYMIHYGDYYSNVDTDKIILLLSEWDIEDCMDAPSTPYMRESYAIKFQIHDPDAPTYIETL